MQPIKTPIDNMTKKMNGELSIIIKTKSERRLKNTIMLGWFCMNWDDHDLSSKCNEFATGSKNEPITYIIPAYKIMVITQRIRNFMINL
jgi:hypothetical protein